MNRQWWLALGHLGVAAILYIVSVVIREVFDPGNDHIEPAYPVSGLLVFLGMVLVVLSASHVRHLGWRLVPYLIAAFGALKVLAIITRTLFWAVT